MSTQFNWVIQRRSDVWGRENCLGVIFLFVCFLKITRGTVCIQHRPEVWSMLEDIHIFYPRTLVLSVSKLQREKKSNKRAIRKVGKSIQGYVVQQIKGHWFTAGEIKFICWLLTSLRGQFCFSSSVITVCSCIDRPGCQSNKKTICPPHHCVRDMHKNWPIKYLWATSFSVFHFGIFRY